MRIVVGMSGGADSSLAALLLREAGHEVIGLTAWLWKCDAPAERERACCGSVEMLRRAREAAEAAGVRHEVVDLSEEFEREVVGPALRSLAQALTPSPCVLCNWRVRFPGLLAAARALGAEAIATGHYARLAESGDRVKLFRGADPSCDQSYFLFLVPRDVLAETVFPLGNMTKLETRAQLARRSHPAAARPSSQDLCFAGGRSLAALLKARAERGEIRAEGVLEAGPIVDLEGRILGWHRGLAGYTVGQRRGIAVPNAQPLYVIELRPGSRELVVGPEEATSCERFAVDGLALAEPAAVEFEALVQVRYRSAPLPARVRIGGEGRAEVVLERPARAVAPGQAAVFFRGDEVIGGAWISPRRG